MRFVRSVRQDPKPQVRVHRLSDAGAVRDRSGRGDHLTPGMGLRSPSRCAYRYGTACATAGDEPTVSPESKTLAPDCVAVAAAKVKAGTATVVGCGRSRNSPGLRSRNSPGPGLCLFYLMSSFG